MKPHLTFEDGSWMCCADGVMGLGRTPKTAYVDYLIERGGADIQRKLCNERSRPITVDGAIASLKADMGNVVWPASKLRGALTKSDGGEGE